METKEMKNIQGDTDRDTTRFLLECIPFSNGSGIISSTMVSLLDHKQQGGANPIFLETYVTSPPPPSFLFFSDTFLFFCYNNVTVTQKRGVC